MATVAALKQVERDQFDHYFDTLIPDRHSASDWSARHELDAALAASLGGEAPAPYSSRDQYKAKVASDLEQARKIIRRLLTAGIAALGPNGYEESAIKVLQARLHTPRPNAVNPGRVALLASVLPILYDTTRDIGTASAVVTINDAANQLTVPAVLLTSSFNITLMRISRLLVQRTLFAVARYQHPGEAVAATVKGLGTLSLRMDCHDLAGLQRDARALFHLLGIWLVGEPFRTPPVDQTVLNHTHVGAVDRNNLINLVALDHKSGWCLFEALHEFAHVLFGDWLVPTEKWTTDLEVRADAFAATCLLQEPNDLSRIFFLRGACSFLALLGVIEQRHGRTQRYPDAWLRARCLEELVLSSNALDPADKRLFILSSKLDVLAAYSHNPEKFGGTPETLFGE